MPTRKYKVISTAIQVGLTSGNTTDPNLRHDSVVCEVDGLDSDVPCSLPAQRFLVDQKAHELWNPNGWVCIIKLAADLAGKVSKIRMTLLEPGNNVLCTKNITNCSIRPVTRDSALRFPYKGESMFRHTPAWTQIQRSTAALGGALCPLGCYH